MFYRTILMLKTPINTNFFAYAWQYKHCHGKLS